MKGRKLKIWKNRRNNEIGTYKQTNSYKDRKIGGTANSTIKIGIL